MSNRSGQLDYVADVQARCAVSAMRSAFISNCRLKVYLIGCTEGDPSNVFSLVINASGRCRTVRAAPSSGGWLRPLDSGANQRSSS
jgi:hypothetical protein